MLRMPYISDQSLADATHITSPHSALECTCGAKWETQEEKLIHNEAIREARMKHWGIDPNTTLPV